MSFGIIPIPLFHSILAGLEIDLPFEHLYGFFVANRIESKTLGSIPSCENTLDLFDEPLSEHFFDPIINPVVELCPITIVWCEEENIVEWFFFLSENLFGLPGFFEYLERSDDRVMTVGMNRCSIFAINLIEHIPEIFIPVLEAKRLHTIPVSPIRCHRRKIEMKCYCIKIESCSSAEDGHLSLLEHTFDDGGRLSLIFSDRIFLIRISDIDKVMGYTIHFLMGYLTGSDIEETINLTRIRTDYFGAEMLRDLDSKSGFTARSRSVDDDEFR